MLKNMKKNHASMTKQYITKKPGGQLLQISAIKEEDFYLNMEGLASLIKRGEGIGLKFPQNG